LIRIDLEGSQSTSSESTFTEWARKSTFSA
jgi:hypothetical protein